MKPSNWINPTAKSNGPPPKNLSGFLKWALSGSFTVLVFSGMISIITGMMDVSAALILGLMIDSALTSTSENLFEGKFLLYAASIAFFLILRPTIFAASTYMQTIVVTPNIFNLVLSRIHRWTLNQSVTFFDNDFAGRIAQKEMQTARAVSDVVVEVLQTVLFALASIVGATLMLFAVDKFLAATLFFWLFAYLTMIKYFMPIVRKRSGKRAGARAMVTGQIVDTVTNIKTVKLFAHNEHEDRAALRAMDDFRFHSIKYGVVASWFRFCLNFLGGILPVMMVGGSLWFWSSGSITAGDIAATGTIALRLSQMTGWVSYVLMALYSNLGEIEDGMKTLSPDHDLTDVENAKPLSVKTGKIEFNKLSFAYGGRVSSIDNVSLTISPGEKVGVVGASGAGKSTLVSILLRLYNADKGSVKIDNQDLKLVSQESLRLQIGMVTQETALFNRSAMDNILYGNPSASKENVFKAAQQAEAHEFILSLKDHKGRAGYEAHLGEQGVKLSGGERQRIALARAILKDAPILVLDEATSALDSEVESAIQTALERVMEGKTVLAIAHRLSTLVKMDKIVVMDKGKVVEVGPHEFLVKKGGLYSRYWTRQSGGFIETRLAAE